MLRLEPQDQKLKITQNQSIFWEILWETSYLFYHPSNFTVCATSNNSIAAAHPSPSINLLLKRRQSASRENTHKKGAQTQQQGSPVAHPDLPALTNNQQHIYNILDRLSNLLLPKSGTNPPISVTSEI